jgi:hypothetical protein
MKIDLKTGIAIGAVLFSMAGFYYTTTNDLDSLSLEIKGLSNENRDQQRRIDSLDRKTFRLNKKIRELNK